MPLQQTQYALTDDDHVVHMLIDMTIPVGEKKNEYIIY